MYNFEKKTFSEFYQTITHLGILKYPTGNCQWACIRHANIFLNAYTLKKRLECFHKIREVCKQSMILLDIQDSLVTNVKEIFDDDFIKVDSPYESTNGSKMTILLLDFRALDKPNNKLLYE